MRARKIKEPQESEEAPVSMPNHTSVPEKMRGGRSEREISARARVLTQSDHVGKAEVTGDGSGD
jgi:hypothetical protein